MFTFSSFRWYRWRLLVGTLGFWELDSVLEPITGVELPKEVFTSRVRWMPLIVKWNASANMFYHLKHLLLLILVILKLKCNNLIFNEIIILYASYVCLMHSRFIENHPIWIFEDWPLISEVILSKQGRLRGSGWPRGPRPYGSGRQPPLHSTPQRRSGRGSLTLDTSTSWSFAAEVVESDG
jgi:hypothetical protein